MISHLDITIKSQKHPKTTLFTLPETNIAPENGWLEYYLLYYFPFGMSGMAYFQVRTVSFRKGIYLQPFHPKKTSHPHLRFFSCMGV